MSGVRRVSDGVTLPLSALLSQVLVAFVIEYDNSFECEMPHRTTRHGATADAQNAPWLVSLAMWVHCMRHVPVEGIGTRELARAAGLDGRTARMVFKRMSAWWGYLTIDTVTAKHGARNPARRVCPTAAGRQAQRIWAPLTDTIEDRWRERHGETFEALRSAAAAVVGRLEVPVPDYLPFEGQARPWRTRAQAAKPRGQNAPIEELPLWALLSKLLVAFALEFENEGYVPLALSANVIRVLDGDGVRVGELPRLTGLARMGVDNQLGLLERQGHVEVGTDPAAKRAKLARLTATGRRAHDDYLPRGANVEQAWKERFGTHRVGALRSSLHELCGDTTAAHSPLHIGLDPGEGGWRASLPTPDTLPHYPMVTHRGGFPDGS